VSDQTPLLQVRRHPVERRPRRDLVNDRLRYWQGLVQVPDGEVERGRCR
jgi:hypothetical protein